MVSCPPWLHGIPYPQETIREGFPVRLGSMVFLTDRKLFAYGFLSDLIPWCFIPIGNYSRMVSCPAWLHGFPYRQETFCLWFPVRLDSMVFHTDRKLFAYGFLSGLAPLCFLPAGNCSRRRFLDSARNDKRAWLHSVSYRQETIREGDFSTPLCSARNDSRAWLHCVSYRQETVREGFPIRLGSMVFFTDRKLFAYGFLFGLALWCFLPTGNYSRRVSCTTWLHGAPYLQETFHSPSYPCKLSSCRGGSISLYLD